MILMTGATGFVGRALVRRLVVDSSFNGVVVAVRRKTESLPQGAQQVPVVDLTPTTDCSTALPGIGTVVHCAAPVHLMRDDAVDPLQAYREGNVSGTLRLARQAAHAGVRRFVFVSSIKLNKEATRPGHLFTVVDVPALVDSSGVSKLEAEEGMREIGAQTGTEVVVVRPPLVYGPSVKAKFASMMRWVARGVLLPLGAVHHAINMAALDKLMDLWSPV